MSFVSAKKRRPQSRTYVAVVALFALLASPLLVAWQPQAAAAAETRSITGTITLPQGTPAEWLRGVQVSAQGVSGSSSFSYVKPDPTTGEYALTSLEPGSYRVHFNTTSYWNGESFVRPNLVSEFSGNTVDSMSAIPIDVSTTDAQAVDADLALGRIVAGTVTLPDGADPEWLKGVWVGLSGDGGYVPSVPVDPTTGNYAISGIAPGKVRVQFSVSTYWDPQTDQSVRPPLVSQYFSGATDWSSATLVDVTSADRRSIDAALAIGRTISGTVSLPAGAPAEWLGSIGVTARSVGGSISSFTTPDPATGQYTITGLAATTYTVSFQTLSGSGAGAPNLTDQYYDGASSSATATPVDVTAADRDGIDARLEAGASISGTVSIPRDAPANWLNAVHAYAMDADGNFVGYGAQVDPSTGAYSITRLTPGEYNVYFSASSFFDGAGWVSTDLAAEYYDDASHLSAATLVSTGSGDVRNIDASLEHGGGIEGSIDLSALRAASGGVGLTLTDLSGLLVYTAFGDGITDTSHEFGLSNLTPGRYRLALSTTTDGSDAPPVATSVQFLRFGADTSFEVKAGQTTRNVQLSARATDGSLSGAVSVAGIDSPRPTDIGGSALLYEQIDGQWTLLPDSRFDVEPNATRAFDLALAPGTYTVGFETTHGTIADADLREEWWQGRSARDDAEPITLTSGQRITGVDGTIRPRGIEPEATPVPIYRFWSPTFQGHFYTADEAEREKIVSTWKKDWTYEGPRYSAFTSQVPGSIPLYRFWSDRFKGHFYTADRAERDKVRATWADTWTYEGIAYYVYPTDTTVADTVEVFRFWGPSVSHHFYTASSAERDKVNSLWSNTWSDEGARFRVPSIGVPTETPPAPSTPATGTPTTTPSPPPTPSVTNPGDSKNCGDFSTYAQAKAWFDTYYAAFGDVARLDNNGDLIPCESLPGAP